ncbi:Uncharacterised protein [uncultured archaeon]|nr:Uncharacterised protein [uncultured archaeon]
MALDGHGPHLILDQRRVQPLRQRRRIAHSCRQKDELSLGRSQLQPGDHARQPVTALRVLQHVHLVDHHCPYLPQALLGADRLVYALVGPGDDVGVQALLDLAGFAHADAAHTNADGGLKAQFAVAGELVELLIGQGNQGNQKQQLALAFQQILDSGHLANQALSRGCGGYYQLVPALQEPCLHRPGLYGQKLGQSLAQHLHERHREID